MLVALANFFLTFFRRAVSFFSGLPGKISILITAFSSVVYECRSFVDSLNPYFESIYNSLVEFVNYFARYLQGEGLDIFQMFCYCTALDTLVGLVVTVVGFVGVVLSFLLVAFVHAVFFYFGLKFGYAVYKSLLTVASNGLSKV